jgi:predicted ATPase
VSKNTVKLRSSWCLVLPGSGSQLWSANCIKVGFEVQFVCQWKFDQYKRDIPYATIAEAFQGLVRQILTLDERELERWKLDLLEALGPNGQLLINVSLTFLF